MSQQSRAHRLPHGQDDRGAAAQHRAGVLDRAGVDRRALELRVSSGQNEASALAGASPTGRPAARTNPEGTHPSCIEATALRRVPVTISWPSPRRRARTDAVRVGVRRARDPVRRPRLDRLSPGEGGMPIGSKTRVSTNGASSAPASHPAASRPGLETDVSSRAHMTEWALRMAISCPQRSAQTCSSRATSRSPRRSRRSLTSLRVGRVDRGDSGPGGP